MAVTRKVLTKRNSSYANRRVRRLAERNKEKHSRCSVLIATIFLQIGNKRSAREENQHAARLLRLRASACPPMCGASHTGVSEIGGQSMSLLYSPTTLGPLALKNRLVMSPTTRSRAPGTPPGELAVE